MRRPAATSSSIITPPNYGRIGIVGLRSAGKTGTFVAIASLREATTDGRTASLVALESNPHPDLVAGRQWIEKCQSALQAGKLPEANEVEAPRLVLRCQFTEGKQLHHVEGMDYSGELLDPSVSTEVMAERLRTYLGQVSGFIVLLEVPPPGQSPAALTGAQHQLVQALALIAEKKKRRRTPMVLAVAKWDRMWPTQSDPAFDITFHPSDVSEDARLAVFLQQQPPPPHVTLLNALTAASGGHAACMPISALGPCERTVAPATGGIVERPVQASPLRSFGLARPFIFIAQRSNELDLDWLRDTVTWGNLFTSFRRTDEALGVADRASARMPEDSAERLEVLGLRRRIRQVRQAQNSSLVALLTFLILVVEASFDHIGHNSALALLTNPEIATEEERLPGENWLATYRDAPPWRHLLYGAVGCLRKESDDLHQDLIGLTRAQARIELASAVAARENRAWRAALQIQNPASQNTVLTEFRRLYPTSEHKDDAKQMILENKRQIDIAECRTALNQYHAELEGVQSASEASAREGTVNAFEVYHKRLQNLFQESKEKVADRLATLHEDSLTKEHTAFLQSHSEVQGRVSTLETQARVRREFNEEWESDQLATTLHMIAHPQGNARGPEYKDLRDRFAAHWQEKATDYLRRTTQGGSGWRKAMEQLDALREAFPQLSSVTGDPEEELRLALQVMEDGIRREGMVFEYAQLGRRPQSHDALTAFMQEFPECPEKQKQAMGELERWFQLCAQPQKLRYTVKHIEFRGVGLARFNPQISIFAHGRPWLNNVSLGWWNPNFAWSREYSLTGNDLDGNRLAMLDSFVQEAVPISSAGLTIKLSGCGEGKDDDAPCSWSRAREEREHPGQKPAIEDPLECIDGDEVIGSKIITLTNGTKFYLVAEIELDEKWAPLAKPALPALE